MENIIEHERNIIRIFDDMINNIHENGKKELASKWKGILEKISIDFKDK